VDIIETGVRIPSPPPILSGQMAEWSIATVLKTVELKGSVGSNPTLSATLTLTKTQNSLISTTCNSLLDNSADPDSKFEYYIPDNE
jgi:hypothetical protein